MSAKQINTEIKRAIIGEFLQFQIQDDQEVEAYEDKRDTEEYTLLEKWMAEEDTFIISMFRQFLQFQEENENQVTQESQTILKTYSRYNRISEAELDQSIEQLQQNASKRQQAFSAGMIECFESLLLKLREEFESLLNEVRNRRRLDMEEMQIRKEQSAWKCTICVPPF